MARYFRALETDSPNDLALLPSSIAARDDLADIAADAEDAVLDHFTRPAQDCDRLAVVLDQGTAVERYVWLRGYATNPANAHASFAAAYRREIAGVIRWLAALRDKKPNVATEAAGEPQTSKTFRPDAERRLPPDFGRALAPYRVQRAHWVI